MALRSVVLDVAIDCPRCMRPIVLEAITSSARCRACLYNLDLPAGRWKYIAASGVESALDGEESTRSCDFADGFTVVSRIRAGDLEVGKGARAPDGLVKAIHKQVTGVLGERAAPASEACEPVAFRCPTCGASARTDGTSRAVTCRDHEVDVPERLWDALHPIPPRATVLLLFKGAR